MLTILAAATLSAITAQATAGAEEPSAFLSGNASETRDPAQLINRGIIYARQGDYERARIYFVAARDSKEWVDLRITSGDWVDSRTLARRALEMLKNGHFRPSSQVAVR